MTVPARLDEGATPPVAIALILASYLLFSFLDTSSKYLVLAGVSPLFVAWTRFAVHVVIVLVVFRSWREPIRFRAANLPAHILRGLFLFGATILNIIALRTMQLAETMSIFFAGPMVITALAGPLLGEWAGWRRWIAILIGLVGVVIITRPGVGVFGVGHLLALGSMLSNSLYVIMTRRMGAKETSESLILYAALCPTILLLPAFALPLSLPQDSWHWFIICMLGVFGGVGHYLLIIAYRMASATALAPYPYSQMIWMIAFGWLIFNQLPDGWTLVGAAVIVAGGLYIVHREHRLRVHNRAALAAETDELAKKLDLPRRDG